MAPLQAAITVPEMADAALTIANNLHFNMAGIMQEPFRRVRGGRTAETMMAAIMATLLPTDDPLKAAIAELARRDIKNLNYDVTGHVTPSAFPLK